MNIVQRTEERLIPYLGELVMHIWPTLQSPVAFNYAKDLYNALVPIVFMNDKDTFGKKEKISKGIHRLNRLCHC